PTGKLKHEAEPVEGASLTIANLRKQFGGLKALNDVTLNVEPGSIHVIVGPNGSGKTTLLNVVSGFYPANGGTIKLDGAELLGMAPEQIAKLGVQRTFQTPKLLGDLSVLENTCFGAYTREKTSGFEIALSLPQAVREKREITREAHQLLSLVGLD